MRILLDGPSKRKDSNLTFNELSVGELFTFSQPEVGEYEPRLKICPNEYFRFSCSKKCVVVDGNLGEASVIRLKGTLPWEEE